MLGLSPGEGNLVQVQKVSPWAGLYDWGAGVYDASSLQNPGGSYVGDGVADDTAAISGAIQAAINNPGGRVILRKGKPKITAALTPITVDGVSVEGDGWDTVLTPSGNFDVLTAIATGGGNFRRGIRVANLMWDCSLLTGGNALVLNQTYEALVDWVRIIDCKQKSIYLTGGASHGAYNQIRHSFVELGQAAAAIGIHADASELNTLDALHCFWFNTLGGIGVKLQTGANRLRGCIFDECDTAVWSNQFDNEIADCDFDRGGTHHVNLPGCARNLIHDCTFGIVVGAGTNVIDVSGGANTGSRIHDNIVVTGSGWTNFVSEAAGTGGGPGNLYDGNVTQGLGMVLVTGIARSNPGYNPVGVVTPAVPASGVALAAIGYDRNFWITTGAGATTILIQGGPTITLAASTAGQYVRLPAGQTMTPTYANAPTWVVEGE